MNVRQMLKEREQLQSARDEIDRTIAGMSVVIDFYEARNGERRKEKSAVRIELADGLPPPTKNGKQAHGFWETVISRAMKATGARTAKPICDWVNQQYDKPFSLKAVQSAVARYREAVPQTSKHAKSIQSTSKKRTKKRRRMSAEGEARRMAGYRKYLESKGYQSGAALINGSGKGPEAATV